MSQIKTNPQTPEELLCKIASILGKLNIPYIITGGMAVAVWGRPRFTADIDVVVKLVAKNIPLLAKTLAKIDKDVYIDEEAIQDAFTQKGEFNFIHPQSGLKVDFWISKESSYNKLVIERGVRKKIRRQKINFISPEDLILSKLIWYKENSSSRHLEDIESILKISKVNSAYLEKWTNRQSTLKNLRKILKSS